MDLLAFLVALPIAVELIAAAYGPLDLARYPRLALLALVRLVFIIAIVASLIWWLGTPFTLGVCTYAFLFVLKHFANNWQLRRPAEHQKPIWSNEQSNKIPGDN